MRAAPPGIGLVVGSASWVGQVIPVILVGRLANWAELLLLLLVVVVVLLLLAGLPVEVLKVPQGVLRPGQGLAQLGALRATGPRARPVPRSCPPRRPRAGAASSRSPHFAGGARAEGALRPGPLFKLVSVHASANQPMSNNDPHFHPKLIFFRRFPRWAPARRARTSTCSSLASTQFYTRSRA